MNKKLFIALSVTLCAFVVGVSFSGDFFSTTALSQITRSNPPIGTYYMSFDGDANRVHNHNDENAYSDDVELSTDIGNPIEFSYQNIKYSANSWHTIAPEGFISNLDEIFGLSTITIYFGSDNTNFKIYYSDTELFSDIKSETLVSSSSVPTIYNFDDEPAFFRIENIDNSDLEISSFRVEYSCRDKSLESEYEYENVEGGIKLTKYIGEYKSVIDVPESIDGKNVVSIASGCFEEEQQVNPQQLAKRNKQNDDEKDYSTYYIPESVESIEENSFPEHSTFFTSSEESKNGWEDTSMTGSAKKGNGNVYYSTNREEVITYKGIVYAQDGLLNGYYLARCLTQRHNIVIPSHINGYPVIDIGRESFAYNRHIKSVVFPETIGYIYFYAFIECQNLESVEMNCPNLSKILRGSFSECRSLDRVTIPENCTYLQPLSFANCGTISYLYIPVTMVHICADAFYLTSLSEVVYQGNEEQWNRLYNEDETIAAANVTYLNQANQSTVLNDLRDIENIDNGTKVTLEGVISGFYNLNKDLVARTIMVKDPTRNFYVNCFAPNGIGELDNIELIGRKIIVTGLKMLYTGMVELADSIFTLDDDDTKYDLNPIELISDDDFDYESNLYRLVSITGRISSYDKSHLFIENFNKLFAFNSYTSTFLSGVFNIGDVVQFYAWVGIFNTTYEYMYDPRTVVLIERQ